MFRGDRCQLVDFPYQPIRISEEVTSDAAHPSCLLCPSNTSLRASPKHYPLHSSFDYINFSPLSLPILIVHPLGESPGPNQRSPLHPHRPRLRLEPRHKVAYCCFSSLNFNYPDFRALLASALITSIIPPHTEP